MSKRYGIKPSEFLRIDLKEYQFNCLVAQTGIEFENQQQQKAIKAQEKASRRGR